MLLAPGLLEEHDRHAFRLGCQVRERQKRQRQPSALDALCLVPAMAACC